MWSSIQNVLDQVSKNLPGTDLHEDPAAVLVNLLDLGVKYDRMKDVAGQDLLTFFGIFRVDLSSGVGIYRDRRLLELLLFDCLSKRSRGMFHQGCVKGSGDRKLGYFETRSSQDLVSLIDSLPGSGQDELGGRVLIGDQYILQVFDLILDFLPGPLHSCHGPGIKVLILWRPHGLTAGFDQPQEGIVG